MNVTERPMLHILNCQNLHEMWQKLVEVYEGKTETSKHILQQKWFTLTKEDTDDVAVHISKIQELAYRLKTLGEDISDSMIMTKILMTLPINMNHFISAWESTSEQDRTLSNLAARLEAEETRLKTQDSSQSGALFVGKGKKLAFDKRRKPGVCHNCGKPGHWKRECRTKKKSTKYVQ